MPLMEYEHHALPLGCGHLLLFFSFSFISFLLLFLYPIPIPLNLFHAGHPKVAFQKTFNFHASSYPNPSVLTKPTNQWLPRAALPQPWRPESMMSSLRASLSPNQEGDSKDDSFELKLSRLGIPLDTPPELISRWLLMRFEMESEKMKLEKEILKERVDKFEEKAEKFKERAERERMRAFIIHVDYLRVTGNLNLRGIIEAAEKNIRALNGLKDETRRDLYRSFLMKDKEFADQLWACWGTPPGEELDGGRTREDVMAGDLTDFFQIVSSKPCAVELRNGHLIFDSKNFVPRDVCAVKMLADVVAGLPLKAVEMEDVPVLEH